MGSFPPVALNLYVQFARGLNQLPGTINMDNLSRRAIRLALHNEANLVTKMFRGHTANFNYSSNILIKLKLAVGNETFENHVLNWKFGDF